LAKIQNVTLDVLKIAWINSTIVCHYHMTKGE